MARQVGYKQPERTKLKISRTLQGQKKSKEHKKNIAAAMQARKNTETA